MPAYDKQYTHYVYVVKGAAVPVQVRYTLGFATQF